jgi:hypothetical protein
MGCGVRGARHDAGAGGGGYDVGYAVGYDVGCRFKVMGYRLWVMSYGSRVCGVGVWI